MRLYFDSEFTGLHKNTTLISLALISDDDKSFYAEFLDYDKSQLNSWLNENVINNLLFKHIQENTIMNYDLDNFKVVGTIEYVKQFLLKWILQFDKCEIWGDAISYDWVLLNEFWNGSLNTPSNIYYLPFDLVTLLKSHNIDPDVSREKFGLGEMYTEMLEKKHNSLYDANIIKECVQKLEKEHQ